jgi:hypothetical protein
MWTTSSTRIRTRIGHPGSRRATVIGGAALQLLGVIHRPTQDCVLQAAAAFAAAQKTHVLEAT